MCAAIEEAMKSLETQLKKSAKEICQKYINPPRTTDFALMFLPTEGLYAEAIRRVGLVEQVQRDCRVIFAGPTTLAALLNSLQMGFRTLAIQKRSSEVWNLLAGVKTEFRKIWRCLIRGERETRSGRAENGRCRCSFARASRKNLRDVEELPDPNPQPLPEQRTLLGDVRRARTEGIRASVRNGASTMLSGWHKVGESCGSRPTPSAGSYCVAILHVVQSRSRPISLRDTSSHFALSLSMISRSRRIGGMPCFSISSWNFLSEKFSPSCAS